MFRDGHSDCAKESFVSDSGHLQWAKRQEDEMRKLTLLWILAVCTAAIISASVTAQVQVPFDQIRILSGDDIGFRVEGQRRAQRTNPQTGRTAPVNILTGQLMVKVNGQWVEAEISGGGIRPATN
jgi:hypothetical protein